MAEFTGPNLNQPNAVPFESVAQPAPAPRLAGIGKVISDELEERAEARAAAEEASIFGEVVEEQTTLAEAFLQDGETLTPAEQSTLDVFNQGDDFDRQQALKNPNVKSALNKLDRIRQARSQAKSPEQLERFYLQAAQINKRIVNDHPQFAEVVIEASKKALGFDPLEKAIGIEESQALKQQEFELQQKKTMINKAVEAGVVDLAADGSFDEQDAIRKGQALLQQEYLIDQMKAQADLASAQRIPEADLKRSMFSNFMKSTNLAFQSDIGEWGANLLQLYPNLANDPQSQAKIQEAWNVKRATFLANQDRYIAEIPDPDVQSKAREALEARLSTYDELFTGDFSTLETRTRMLKLLSNNAQIELNQSAPTLSRILQLGGDQVASSVISGLVTSTDLNSTLSNEISQFAQGQPSGPAEELQTFSNFISGEVPLESMTDKQARSTIRHSTAALNKLSEHPNDVTDKELDVYSTMALQLAAVGVNKTLDPDNLQAAAKTVSTPSKMRLFERYANDPNSDPEKVQALAEGIGAINLKNINRQVPLFSQTPIANIPASPDLKEGPRTVTVSPVYNTETGKVELTDPGVDQFGRPVPIPSSMTKRVQSINQSINAALVASRYEGGQFASFNEQQMKQFIADTAGLPTEGPRVELPEAKEQPEGEQPRAPRTNEEMVNALIEAGRKGDKETIQRILSGGLSQVNFNQPLPQGDLNEKILTIAADEGVDVRLLSKLVQVESGGNPSAVSPVGAIGLTQLMPATAEELGVDPNDPDENLRGGARYLKQQINTFGDVRKALAAYNWGPSRVKRAVKEYGDEWDQHLPEETENYIKRILGE